LNVVDGRYDGAVATVARFNVTSVKSTALRHPGEIRLTERGVEGDRAFLFLEAGGRRVSTAAKAPLLGVQATHDHVRERLTLELPDGTTVEGDATPTGERQNVTMYDRSIPVRTVDGPLSETVSRYLGRDVLLARAEPPESAGGNHRVSIVSLASVAELGRRGDRGIVPDPRRFRMLVEVDGTEAHEEDSWSGRRIRLGEVIVRVGEGIPRCMVTNLDPDSGEPDFPTLDVLASYRKRNGELQFGVYGDVERPGLVRVGDHVEPLSD
jgi:uncharacterized protein YcbX